MIIFSGFGKILDVTKTPLVSPRTAKQIIIVTFRQKVINQVVVIVDSSLVDTSF